MKSSNARKSTAKAPEKLSSQSSSRSVTKPILILTGLIAVALAAAFLLVKRNTPDSTAATPSQPSASGSGPVVTSEGWAKGNLAARTVLVEFGDFQCPSCAAARLKVDNALKKFEKEIKVVFKQYPMQQIHRNAMLAAQAAESAGRQMKFWEMYELLFARQNEWTNVPDGLTFYLKYATELQLDVERFRQDLFDGEIRNKIFRDMLEGQVAQVRSVPTFFLNGKMLPTVKSDAEFEELIAQAIRTAQ